MLSIKSFEDIKEDLSEIKSIEIIGLELELELIKGCPSSVLVINLLKMHNITITGLSNTIEEIFI